MTTTSNPTPSGKMRVCVNMLTDVHVNAKKVSHEEITRMGPIPGMKRKRKEDDEEESGGKAAPVYVGKEN